jgi:pseudouridine-5'-phosphate glycosidase
MSEWHIEIGPEAREALAACRPVVALESSLIAHGLPWPLNLETARAAEQVVREEGAVPATIAVWQGRPTIGLADEDLVALAQTQGVFKASRRDLAVAVAQGISAGTTVAATMFLAHRAGIRILATGGIGGAHRGHEHAWDISADLIELGRTPVAVVCAGAKSVLDIPRTIAILETYSVPVVGYGTDDFPAFYLRSSGEPVSARVDTVAEAARLLRALWDLGGAGFVLAQPIETNLVLEDSEFEQALRDVEQQATAAGVRGKELTPFLLKKLGEATEGKTLRANKGLVVANARLAAQLALQFFRS